MPRAGVEPVADAIVVAAGESRRMGGTDKLMAPIGDRPLLSWTLDALHGGPVERIVLVAARDRVNDWAAASWLPPFVTRIVAGGPRRQDSVAMGLDALVELGVDDDRVVLVHDGARPALRPALALRVIRATAEHGAAVPVLPIDETIKRIGEDDNVVATVDRTGLATAQTPQGARVGLLREAFRRFPAGSPEAFTDEASLLAACSIPVHAVPGQHDNIKVTQHVDVSRAAQAIEIARPRVGIGRDSHPFGPGSRLMIGGVAFPEAPQLTGHSDGDVALHAIADALLGAAAMGDLGRIFPADSRTPQGADSGALLSDVVGRIHAAGMSPGFVDVTIVASRPTFGPRLEEIRSRIAELLSIRPDRVSVKASTGNLDGLEGTGRGISAYAIATLVATR